MNGEIKAGEEVVVKKVKDLNLWVTKNNKEEK